MTKNQSLLWRIILFIAGAGILVTAFFLTKGESELTPTDIFIWSSIGLMYIVFFLPFFFPMFRVSDFSGKIPALPVLWLGIIVYIIASTAVIILLKTVPAFTFNIAIVVQSILVFLFLIVIYISFFAVSRTVRVAEEEKAIRRPTGDIKAKALSLALSADRLGSEYEKAQKILKAAFDDIKYLSPVNNNAGNEVEEKIFRSLLVLEELCGNVHQGAHPGTLETEASKLQMLVKERKLLRN